jgi:proteic killer suppression protein
VDIFEVLITKAAQKDLTKTPHHIISKLIAWIDSVSISGIREIRKTLSFHDEPLKGKRLGQRSIRLSKAYRAIYVIAKNGSVEIICITEVNKHEY